MNLLRTVSSLSCSDKAKSDCYCLRHAPWHQMEEGGISSLSCWVDATILLTLPDITFSLIIFQSSAPYPTVPSLGQFLPYTQISISAVGRKVTLETSFLPSSGFPHFAVPLYEVEESRTHALGSPHEAPGNT